MGQMKILRELQRLEDNDEFTLSKLAKGIGKSVEETRNILGDLGKRGLVELDEYDEIVDYKMIPVLMNATLTKDNKEVKIENETRNE